MGRACALGLLLACQAARADPVRLRLATPAPEGSSYARELHSFSRDLSSATGGHLAAKWYMGGIAGDELTQIERIQRGQLEGAGLALGCERLAPSLLAVRVVGLLHSRDEASLVMRHLKLRIDQEMRQSGFVGLGLGTLGSVLAMTRTPVHTLDELKKLRLWVWDKDEIQLRLLRAMGFHPAPLPVEEAGPAYDEGRIDGFLAVPGAALALQWSARARYYLDFPLGQMSVCFAVAQRTFDQIPFDERRVLEAAGAKLSARIEEIGRAMDDALIGGLFERQGLKRVAADATLTREFLAEARLARERLDKSVVPAELMSQVLAWLADYRAETQQPTSH
jgi:TRAP-type C4-dicarboxylate transport system substrate-binding protein